MTRLELDYGPREVRLAIYYASQALPLSLRHKELLQEVQDQCRAQEPPVQDELPFEEDV